jgi:predicted MFS family arabinose efflux permease
MATTVLQPEIDAAQGRLPMAALLALFTAGFVAVLTETLPAGLLPEMSATFGTTESLTGQLVTVYAIGTAVSVIPLNLLLRSWGRRSVILVALVGFTVANAATTFAPSIGFAFVARFVAGIAAGLIWSNIGGYAARLSPGARQGRGIAIAMAGAPVALSLGLPAGAFLGATVSWQLVFGLVTSVTILLIIWVALRLPDFAGQTPGVRINLRKAAALRGLPTILLTLAGFVVAHNLLYTYIGPLVVHTGIGNQLQWVLLVFGVASIVSIWLVGTFIDQHHRKLIVGGMALFTIAALALSLSAGSAVVLYIAAAAWGLTFGGATTLFLTAGSRAAGAAADVAQALMVTVFNVGIALGGFVGGLLLATFGIEVIPWVAFVIMVPTALSVVVFREHAFPSNV